MRILIAGCGRIGSLLGIALAKQSHKVWGLRRRGGMLPPEVHPLQGDLTEKETLASLPSSLDFVFYTASSGGSSKEAYRAAYSQGIRNLIDTLTDQRQKIRRLFFISSTGVYAQQEGEWIDENSPTRPDHDAGRYLLKGESIVNESPYPGTIVRLAGIYGPGRIRLIKRIAQGKEACNRDRTQYSNLIHLTDCVATLFHLMRLANPSELYVAADNQPVDRCILLNWLSSQLDAPRPISLPAEQLPVRQLRSNKRCSNRRLLESGYCFRFPTFREGYSPLIKDYKKLSA